MASEEKKGKDKFKEVVAACVKHVKETRQGKIDGDTESRLRTYATSKGQDADEVLKKVRETLSDPMIEVRGKAEIVRSEETKTITLPIDMSLEEGIVWLQRQKEYEEQAVDLHFDFDAYPWDGALNLRVILEETFGFMEAKGVGMFGMDKPPDMIEIEVGPGEFKQVIWGKLIVPGVDGGLQTGAHFDKQTQTWKFLVTAKIKRKHEGIVRALMEGVRQRLKTHSIYRGKAIHLRMSEEGQLDQGSAPKFLTFPDNDTLILNDSIEAALAANVFTPVVDRELCALHGVPFKRGILLTGKYGTGKTMAAASVARKCVTAKVTYIYIDDPKCLPNAIPFARQYAPAVIFAEDVDRAAGIERDDTANAILNAVDGIESKGSQIMLILTTNHPERINRAMLRPGRLDSVIVFNPPDPKTVGRLIEFYGRESLRDDLDMTYACQKLNGQIPAVIRESVERAKLFAVSRKSMVDGEPIVDTESLNFAVDNMLDQVELLLALDSPQVESVGDRLAGAFTEIVEEGRHGGAVIRGIEHKVEKIASEVGA